MTPEEKDVIKFALRWDRDGGYVDAVDLQKAVQRLKISRQPEHTVEPIPCMVYANNSATMHCVLPVGHEGSEPDKYGFTHHKGYGGGDPKNGRRLFRHSMRQESMETHERPACPRFPGCERHP